MTLKIQRGVVVGAVIALVGPVLDMVLGLLIQFGVISSELVRPFVDILTFLALLEVVLGPAGILIAGRSAGIRGAGPWLALIIVTVPVLAIAWFIALVTLGGATGNPF